MTLILKNGTTPAPVIYTTGTTTTTTNNTTVTMYPYTSISMSSSVVGGMEKLLPFGTSLIQPALCKMWHHFDSLILQENEVNDDDGIFYNDLRRIVMSSAYLMGGAIPMLAHGEEPNDWDIWFRTKGEAEECIRLVKTNPNVKVLAETENALTFVDGRESGKYFKNKYQFIRVRAGSPTSIGHSFDFTHVTAFAVFRSSLPTFPTDWDEVVSKKLLRLQPYYTGPIHQERINKWVARGYKVEDPGVANLRLLVKADDGHKDLLYKDPVRY